MTYASSSVSTTSYGGKIGFIKKILPPWIKINKPDDTLLTWDNSLVTWNEALFTWDGLTILIRNVVDFIKNNRPTDNWTKQ